MRKLYFTIIIYFISIEVIAQNKLPGILPVNDGKVTYSNLIQLQGVSKNVIYTRVNGWLLYSNNNAKNVIQRDDKEMSQIIGKNFFREKWMFRFYTPISINVWKIIKIQIQNDRFRYEICDLGRNNNFSQSKNETFTVICIPLKEWNKGHDSHNIKFYSKINEQMITLIKSLKYAVNQDQNDDW